MKVYIASHCRWAGLYVASMLESHGHQITSRWLKKPFNPTEKHTESQRINIAKEDVMDIMNAEALILIAGPDRYPGGKFVETGIAFGVGEKIFILGRRENMLLWHPEIQAFDSIEEIVNAIG